MKLLLATIFKEFLQLLRNRALLFLVLACPVILLGIIPLSFDGSTRLRAAVCDSEGSYQISEMLGKLSGNPLFQSVFFYENVRDAEFDMDSGKLDIIINWSSSGLQIILDGTFPRRALNAIYIFDVSLFESDNVTAVFHTMFNEGRKYNHYSLISLIILVVTLVGTALITLNIVKERENGLEEQLRASVMNRFVYFSGKFVFFVVLCLSEIVLCLLFCHFVYGLENRGAFTDLMLVNLIFLFPLLGLGLVIAAFSRTQLQAVYVLTITLILLTMLSTMFTHLSSMPDWAAVLRYINPVYYGIESSRMVIFKGAGLADISRLVIYMVLSGLFLNLVAFMKFRKA